MELLISIVVSTLTEILKFISGKFGYEMTKKFVSGIVLALCLVGTYLYTKGVITQEMIKTYVEILLQAVGYYELVYKRILTPVFDSIKNKLT